MPREPKKQKTMKVPVAQELSKEKLEEKALNFFERNPNQSTCLMTGDGFCYADNGKKAKAAQLHARNAGVSLNKVFKKVTEEPVKKKVDKKPKNQD